MARAEDGAGETTELFRVASKLFLFLTSFRRKVRRGIKISPDELATRLEDILAEQERAVRRDAGLESLYEKARYPLVVLADETVLQSGWEFARQWENRLLEQRYFGTNVSGEKYFAMVDELRPDDIELAAILYTGLSLGFGGKYRDRPEKLVAYKKKLYRQMSEYLSTGDKLTPDAYRVLAGKPPRLSPVVTLVRVAVIGFGILVFYWIATAAVWSSSLGGVREAARAMGLS